jgi:hypothetical protein
MMFDIGFRDQLADDRRVAAGIGIFGPVDDAGD